MSLLKLNNYLNSKGLDAFYVSSTDAYLNEYTPLNQNLCYLLTGFSGSVSELLIHPSGGSFLFVDGRYHLQAEKEVGKEVTLVKVPYIDGVKQALFDKIKEFNCKRLGFLAARTSLQKAQEFKKVGLDLFPVGEHSQDELNFLKEVLSAKNYDHVAKEKTGTMEKLADQWRDESVKKKLEGLFSPAEGAFIQALDQIAWATGYRGSYFPYQLTFPCQALVGKDSEGELFLDLFCEAKRPGQAGKDEEWISFLGPLEDSLLNSKIDEKKLEKISYNPDRINYAGFLTLQKTEGIDLISSIEDLNNLQRYKSSLEIKGLKDSHQKAMEAIYKTLVWGRKAISEDKSISELTFKKKLEEEYKKKGARGQSFKSIVGVAGNGAIIHYSSPSAEVFLKEGELLLVDSGGFFESGIATDCTRTIHLGGRVSAKQKKLYTLVLKGLLKAQNAIFPVGTWGSQIDTLAREALWEEGLNYAHGTGHGVGINVHESGFRLAPTSDTPLYSGLVGSIEPGIYLPNEFGIRLENIVVVKDHPTLQGMLCFEPLNYLGFDHTLIDRDLLSNREIKWLEDYEQICRTHGQSF